MKYAVNHPKKFRLPSVAFSVGFMQFLGGLLCEFSCILFLSTVTETIDVIIKFVALAKIAQIDNFYWGAIPGDNKLKRNIGKACLVTTKYRRMYDENDDRSCFIKFLSVVTKVIRIIYASLLFYFIPFAILFIPYFASSAAIPEREFMTTAADGTTVEVGSESCFEPGYCKPWIPAD